MMIYIYDLILNWNDKRRYEFFEWEENDEIEYIKKIPIFRIDNFDDILNKTIKVDADFLINLYNKTEIYGAHQTEKINYACIFCNGELSKAIAMEFSDEGESLYESNIYFLDLEDIFNMANRLGTFNLKCDVLTTKESDDHYLTRREVVKKRFLVNEINDSYRDKNVDKLKYMYYEVFGTDGRDIDEMHNRLLASLKNEYNYVHDNVYNLIKAPNL